MKKNFKLVILLILEALVFYLLPLTAGPTDGMGLVALLLIITFILSILVGLLNTKLKYLYPLIIAILFIPSVFIYYNISALIHSLWYFVISYLGLLLALGLKKIFKIVITQ